MGCELARGHVQYDVECRGTATATMQMRYAHRAVAPESGVLWLFTALQPKLQPTTVIQLRISTCLPHPVLGGWNAGLVNWTYHVIPFLPGTGDAQPSLLSLV